MLSKGSLMICNLFLLFLIKEKRHKHSLIHPKQGRLANVYGAYIQVMSKLEQHFAENTEMDLKPHFIAELNYLSTENGGRKTAAKTGYRPQVQFSFTENQTSGIQKFVDKDSVLPGEKVLAEITVLSPDFFKGRLEVGMEFSFNEGTHTIGTGKVTEIVCEDLKASS
jgi:hypothetical protein